MDAKRKAGVQARPVTRRELRSRDERDLRTAVRYRTPKSWDRLEYGYFIGGHDAPDDGNDWTDEAPDDAYCVEPEDPPLDDSIEGILDEMKAEETGVSDLEAAIARILDEAMGEDDPSGDGGDRRSASSGGLVGSSGT